jgi:hypothetical protein
MDDDVRMSVLEELARRHARTDVRIQLGDPRQDAVELALERVDRHTGFHADETGVSKRAAELGRRVECEGLPELCRGIWILESGRRDADDRRRDAVDAQRFPDRVRVGAEAAAPEAVADHDDVRAARRVFVRGETASLLEADPQQREATRRKERRNGCAPV